MLGTAKKRALTTAGAVLGVMIVSGATAAASIPSSSGTIYGCYAKTNGATRIIDPAKQKCGSTENPISWNQRGPTGPRGPQGPKGDPGTAGAPGAPGTAGVSGYEVVEQSYSRTLPIDESFIVSCPTGKNAFGGGAQVWLEDDSGGFLAYGSAPLWSVPDSGGGFWAVYVRQAAVGGATKGEVKLSVTCGITGP